MHAKLPLAPPWFMFISCSLNNPCDHRECDDDMTRWHRHEGLHQSLMDGGLRWNRLCFWDLHRSRSCNGPKGCVWQRPGLPDRMRCTLHAPQTRARPPSMGHGGGHPPAPPAVSRARRARASGVRGAGTSGQAAAYGFTWYTDSTVRLYLAVRRTKGPAA